jgi:hypothetical protein
MNMEHQAKAVLTPAGIREARKMLPFRGLRLSVRHTLLQSPLPTVVLATPTR